MKIEFQVIWNETLNIFLWPTGSLACFDVLWFFIRFSIKRDRIFLYSLFNGNREKPTLPFIIRQYWIKAVNLEVLQVTREDANMTSVARAREQDDSGEYSDASQDIENSNSLNVSFDCHQLYFRFGAKSITGILSP